MGDCQIGFDLLHLIACAIAHCFICRLAAHVSSFASCTIKNIIVIAIYRARAASFACVAVKSCHSINNLVFLSALESHKARIKAGNLLGFMVGFDCAFTLARDCLSVVKGLCGI